MCSQTSNSKAQVDSHCDNKQDYEVVVEEGGESLSTYLNWSDTIRNHNKFYIAQTLQRKGQTGPTNMAFAYFRYGRVGDKGVKSLIGMDYQKAVKEFKKKTR